MCKVFPYKVEKLLIPNKILPLAPSMFPLVLRRGLAEPVPKGTMSEPK
jgi:hypothetical protein